MRIGRGAFLVINLLLVAAQIAAFVQLEHTLELAVLVVCVIQLVKVPLSAARLADLGVPTDEALIAAIPIANLGLLAQKTRLPSPTPELRAAREAKWAGQLTAFGAMQRATGQFLAVAPLAALVMVPVAALDTMVRQGFLELPERLKGIDPGVASSVRSGLAIATGLLTVYLVLQIVKRSTATRGSWLGALLAVPTGFVWASVAFADAGGQFVIVFVTTAAGLVTPIVWAPHALTWIVLGEGRRSGKGASLGAVIAAGRARGLEFASVHGGVGQIISLGMQVIIPGVHYAIQYVFADFVVVLDPDRPALARSGELARGLRARIFVLLYTGALLSMLVEAAIIAAFHGPDAAWTVWLDPNVTNWQSELVSGFFMLLIWGFIKLALLEIYHDRRQHLGGAG